MAEASGIEIELIPERGGGFDLEQLREQPLERESNLLCIDVGGSTELSVLKHGVCTARKSFKLGAVRCSRMPGRR